MNKNVFKSIGAVLAGFLAIVILSVGTDTVLEQAGVLPNGALFDTGLLLLALMYRSLYSVIGAYIAARLAPNRPMRHALALGVLGIFVSALGALAAQDLGPAWYGLALVLVSLPLAWLGGKEFELRSAR
jgi:surface polysaccharide O-acyltransferase-like enzyme